MTQDSMANDERAIRDLVETWMQASRTGDTATVLSLMTHDVIFQVPGREPFGKEEFAAASQGMKDIRMEGTADIRELRVLGDWAYCGITSRSQSRHPAASLCGARATRLQSCVRSRTGNGCWRAMPTW
jgi:uncharacterized protein (TIGR02246 family)